MFEYKIFTKQHGDEFTEELAALDFLGWRVVTFAQDMFHWHALLRREVK